MSAVALLICAASRDEAALVALTTGVAIWAGWGLRWRFVAADDDDANIG